MVRALITLVVCGALGLSGTAGAQQVDGTLAAETGFGPAIVIESIDIEGNVTTAERLIRRVLPIAPGDRLLSGDPRLRTARFKVLSLGYFRDVELALRRGSQRGRVVVVISVVERGTVLVERIYWGASKVTPWWLGVNVTEQNLLGTGIEVGGAFVIAGSGRGGGGEGQNAFQLRVGDSTVLGSQFGAFATVHRVDASEPFRTAGAFSDSSADNFSHFSYTRNGAIAGVSYRLMPLSRLHAGARVESVHAQLPADPVRIEPDTGEAIAVDLALEDGDSTVVTASIGFDWDTRPDPVLPYLGRRVAVLGEWGTGVGKADYGYGRVFARASKWFPLAEYRHAISIHATGAVVVGDAPRFDLIHVGDLNPMWSPRTLGLVVSANPPLDVFDTGSDEVVFGEVGAAAEVQYSHRVFRRGRHIYGGDVFVGAGLWTLTGAGHDPAFPVDILVDAGLRLDTEIGIFELSVSNALSRVPL